MSKASPTARTLSLLRAEGWQVAIVERRLPRCFRTVDLFNAFDLLAVRADSHGVIGVQVTSGSNHAARVRKVKAAPILPVWIAAGNEAVVISWRKNRAGKWEERRQAVFPSKVSPAPEKNA